MRLATVLVLVSVVSVMFLAGCPNKPPTPAPSNSVGYVTPPTGEDLGSTTPPGAGTEHVITAPPVDPGPGAGAGDTSGGRSYTVKAHDGLMGIARTQLGNEHRWKEILALNPEIKDPNQLKVGQTIKLPAK